MDIDPVKVHLNQDKQKHTFSQQHVSSQYTSAFILTVEETDCSLFRYGECCYLVLLAVAHSAVVVTRAEWSEGAGRGMVIPKSLPGSASLGHARQSESQCSPAVMI